MKLISKNRHAYHDYKIEKEYILGIVLKGHEVKAVKQSNVNIKDSIIKLEKNELWILNMDIPLYEKTSVNLVKGYEPKGKRKLLANKKEIAKIYLDLDKSGTTMIPLEIFISLNGKIKIKAGIAKLFKKVEKKQILKEKDIKKQMDREIKSMK